MSDRNCHVMFDSYYFRWALSKMSRAAFLKVEEGGVGPLFRIPRCNTEISFKNKFKLKCLTFISKYFLFASEPSATFSEMAVRQNAFIMEYCRTSMSALSGSAAGILGLTSLYGFAFYFIMSFVLSVSMINYLLENKAIT